MLDSEKALLKSEGGTDFVARRVGFQELAKAIAMRAAVSTVPRRAYQQEPPRAPAQGTRHEAGSIEAAGARGSYDRARALYTARTSGKGWAGSH